jgi:hypothetical protein
MKRAGVVTAAATPAHQLDGARNMTTNIRRRARPYRRRIIQTLGAWCVCCSENIQHALTIDHVRNDGARERKEFPDVRELYRFFLAEGCPTERYQVLCRNCHESKNEMRGVRSRASSFLLTYNPHGAYLSCVLTFLLTRIFTLFASHHHPDGDLMEHQQLNIQLVETAIAGVRRQPPRVAHTS